MKDAILVVSFGTTYRETLAVTIESAEQAIQEAFPEMEVRRAFTSRSVVRKLRERDGMEIDNEVEALERLRQDGYTRVYIQPLHVVAGEEYDKIRKVVVHSRFRKEFEVIALGRPLLYYTGQEGRPDDYQLAIDAVWQSLPALEEEQGVVLMGHGGLHPANTAYAALQMKLDGMGKKKSYIYTVEGFPALSEVRDRLVADGVKKVLLLPFMLVAGDHVQNDMMGPDEDSAVSVLTKAGVEVSVFSAGLGQNPQIHGLYVQHLKDAIADR